MRRMNVVYSLITDASKSKILMVRNRDNDSWSLPGGAVEDHETLQEAAVREAKEETGYDIKVHGIVAVNEAKLTELDVHAIFFTFRGEILGGVQKVSRPEEITDIQWIDIEKADELMPYYKDGLIHLGRRNREITYFYEGVV